MISKMTVDQVISFNRSFKNLNSLQKDSNPQICSDAEKNKIKLVDRLSAMTRISLMCSQNVAEIKCQLVCLHVHQHTSI